MAWKKVPPGDPFAPEYGADEQVEAMASLLAGVGVLLTLAIVVAVVAVIVTFWGMIGWGGP